METKRFQAKLRQLLSQRNCLAICVIALSAALFKMSAALQKQEERVVIIPTTGPSFWVEKSRTSNEYLSVMGTFLSDLLLTRSPLDSGWKNEQILSHAYPTVYTSLKKSLSEERELILKNQSSFLFERGRSYVNERQLQFVVEGAQRTYIEKPESRAALVQVEPLKYTLSFCCEEGRLYLTHIAQDKL